MKRRATPTSALVITSAVAMLVSACAALRHAPPKADDSTRATTHASASRIAQLGTERSAQFGLCEAAACPSTTPKTLATTSPTATASSANAGAASASGASGLGVPSTASAAVTDQSAVADAASASSSELAIQKPTHSRPPNTTATVHFRFGEAVLTPAAKAVLDTALDQSPDVNRVRIVGRTDSTGPAATNNTLAVARAHSVRDYLRTRRPKLTPALEVEAEGSCCYAASNDTPQGRSRNRRVDVTFGADAEEPL